ncbi:MAG: hypothetical protein Phyf2KO_24950 [Phycisphaerales bacterium]
MHRELLALVLVSGAGAGFAQVAEDRYPEGAATPRELTPVEYEVITNAPLLAARGAGAPAGDVRTVAEYEPMEGILIAYEGPTSWRTVLRNMGRHITTTGNANLYVMCDSASEATSALSDFIASGADASRVFTKVQQTDTIWMRDYGPRYIYENGIRAIVDHTYNRPRPNDNQLPTFWGADRGESVYTIPLVHGGGNYHLDALGGAASTRLIENENPGLTGRQIIELWRDFQGVETTLFDPLPAFVDSTQHIDMWMQIAADDVIVISDWPLEPGSTWDAICDAAAADFSSAGWTVVRTPAIRQGGTHYTFTNVVMCNDIVLLPEYDNISATYSQQALAAWQAAVPSKTVVQVDCDAIVTASGVMHCIVMHIPENSGGLDPVAWITEPDGGSFEAGESVNLTWRTDDDEGVVAVDLLFRVAPSQAFELIASEIADSGSYSWTVPDVNTDAGTLRVVARDAEGREGTDDTDLPISITGSSCLADVNGDGLVNPTDFTAWINAFNNNEPGCDQNLDSTCTPADFTAWIANFNTGC